MTAAAPPWGKTPVLSCFSRRLAGWWLRRPP
jgi:hypothetical protein